MATQMSQNDLDITEQLARIRRISAESDKLNEERLQFTREQFERMRKLTEETDRLNAERRKLTAEADKFGAERRKVMEETKLVSYATIFQGLIAVAALLGAGAALAKLFFS
jgi:uncharacterized coiled-coil DUF342 family protein